MEIRDHRGRYLGRGYYNPRSQIVVRRLTREIEDINEAFFRSRLQAAIVFRQSPSSCYRLVSSEADFLPGLIVDRYGSTLVLQALTLGIEKRKEMFVKLLVELCKPDVILERSDAPTRKLEGLEQAKGILWQSGKPSAVSHQQSAWLADIEINGLKFNTDLLGGQKTGFFLDQTENYRIIEQLVSSITHPASSGQLHVLDCFCYHGGFALHAARAGAHVIGLDQSVAALAIAKDNAKLNNLENQCEWVAANVFDYLSSATKTKKLAAQASPPEKETTGKSKQAAPSGSVSTTQNSQSPVPNPQSPIATPLTPLPSPFDVIILDPPTFTRTRDAVDSAIRGYKEIHLRSLKLLRPGGYLATFCCSHHIDRDLFLNIAVNAATDAHRDLRLVRTLSQSLDHPILPAVPETEYLKGFVFQVV